MLNKKESDNATRASIKKEMAKPRMAESVRIAELNLNAERSPGQARTTMPGSVDKIIASLRPTQSEKARIAVHEADHRYREPRIENSLMEMAVRYGSKGAQAGVALSAKRKK